MKTIAMFLVLFGLCLDANADVIATLQAKGGETQFTDEIHDSCNSGWMLAVYLDRSGQYQIGCWKWVSGLGRVATEYEDGSKFFYDVKLDSFQFTDYFMRTYGGQ